MKKEITKEMNSYIHKLNIKSNLDMKGQHLQDIDIIMNANVAFTAGTIPSLYSTFEAVKIVS